MPRKRAYRIAVAQLRVDAEDMELNACGILAKLKLMAACEGKSADEADAARRELLAKWDEAGLQALPRHALIGVAVNQAVRMSVDAGSKFVIFDERLTPRFE